MRAKSFRITSDSHEYAVLSWFALRTSTCDQASMVDEEADHVPVWGVRPNGVRYDMTLGFDDTMVSVSARDLDQTVGLMETPARLSEIEISFDEKDKHTNHTKDTKEATMAHLMHMAREAYRDYFSKKGISVYYTRRSYESVNWNYFRTIPHRPLSSVVLPNELQKHILSDVKSFYEREKEYTSFGQPHKRVVCLYGPPGTGKTSVVTAVAGELNRSLAIFNADSLRDDTFIELLGDLPHNSILLFEDVDSLFRPDRKASGEGGMTFSSMLNALDGVLSPRGTVIFLTTNHVERLDDAISRPGRIDSLIRIPYAGPDQVAQMWSRAFPKRHPPDTLLRLAGRGEGLSPSKLATELFRLSGLDAKEAATQLMLAFTPPSSSSSSSSSTRKKQTSQLVVS